MKRDTSSYTSCIATASKNTSSLHSAMLLMHSITCLQIFFEETYTGNFVLPKMMSEANSSFSPLFCSVNMEKGNAINLETPYKINKSSYNNNNFLQSHGDKGEALEPRLAHTL